MFACSVRRQRAFDALARRERWEYAIQRRQSDTDTKAECDQHAVAASNGHRLTDSYAVVISNVNAERVAVADARSDPDADCYTGEANAVAYIVRRTNRYSDPDAAAVADEPAVVWNPDLSER